MPRIPTTRPMIDGLKKRTENIPYQAIFFDFDGVLVESAEIKTRAFEALYRGNADDVIKAVVTHHLAHEGISRVEKIRHCHRAYLNIDLGDDELADLAAQYSSLVRDSVVACDGVPGAVDFLENQSGKLPIFVVSGTPEDELIDIIEMRGMSRYFTSIHGSPRHKAPIVTDLLESHALSGPDCLFVGDAMTDYRAAADTGLHFIGRVGQGHVDLFPAGTTIIRDLTELTV